MRRPSLRDPPQTAGRLIHHSRGRVWSCRRSYASGVDAYLAVASKRDQREYAERPVPEDVLRRILDAGRVAGSSKNRQPWRFLVLEDRRLVEQVAQIVYAPSNLLGAPLVIAIGVSRKGPVAFDAGRAAQNMMLVWSFAMPATNDDFQHSLFGGWPAIDSGDAAGLWRRNGKARATRVSAVLGAVGFTFGGPHSIAKTAGLSSRWS